MGTVAFDTDVVKTVDITKTVNLTVNKTVNAAVNLDGNLATAEASADALGENVLAETDTFAQVTSSGAFAFSESLAAFDRPDDTPPPTPPVPVPDTALVELDDPIPECTGAPITREVTIPILDNDQGDIDPSTVTIVASPTHGDAVVNPDGTVTYTATDANTPGVDDSTTDIFAYTVANTQGDVSLPTEVTVNIVDPGGQSVADVDTIPIGNEVQDVVLTVTTDERTADNTACISDIGGRITFGQSFNIAYVIDVSGSTSDPFVGTVDVGDQNNDGLSNTVLDAEILFFKELTDDLVDAGFGDAELDIGLISFETGAQFLGTFEPVSGRAQLDAALENLVDGGSTNFEAALQQSLVWYGSQPVAENIMYFMSDGFPTAGGDFTDEVAALDALPSSRIAIGVGQNSSLVDLDLIDNTPPGVEPNSSAVQVTSPDQLIDLIPEPVFGAQVIDFSVLVNGVDQGVGVADLVPDALGFRYGPFETDDLDPTAGAVNDVVVTALLDGDGDPGTTDDQTTLMVEADLFGVA